MLHGIQPRGHYAYLKSEIEERLEQHIVGDWREVRAACFYSVRSFPAASWFIFRLRVFGKPPLYLKVGVGYAWGRGRICVHSTFPIPLFWEYTGFYVVVHIDLGEGEREEDSILKLRREKNTWRICKFKRWAIQETMLCGRTSGFAMKTFNHPSPCLLLTHFLLFFLMLYLGQVFLIELLRYYYSNLTFFLFL